MTTFAQSQAIFSYASSILDLVIMRLLRHLEDSKGKGERCCSRAIVLSDGSSERLQGHIGPAGIKDSGGGSR